MVCPKSPVKRWAVFYAVSRNEVLWWDLASGAAIGFEPEDNAAADGRTESLPPEYPQGGPYAEAAYSIERMER